jgi:hypothetical protein
VTASNLGVEGSAAELAEPDDVFEDVPKLDAVLVAALEAAAAGDDAGADVADDDPPEDGVDADDVADVSGVPEPAVDLLPLPHAVSTRTSTATELVATRTLFIPEI